MKGPTSMTGMPGTASPDDAGLALETDMHASINPTDKQMLTKTSVVVHIKNNEVLRRDAPGKPTAEDHSRWMTLPHRKRPSLQSSRTTRSPASRRSQSSSGLRA